MGSSLGNIFTVLLNTVCGLYVLVLMARFALHCSQADYFNPVTQGIIKATDWIVAPLQRVIRPLKRFDGASLVAAILVKTLTIGLIYLLLFHGLPSILGLILGGAIGAFSALVKLYFFALIIMIILSWVAPNATHPGALLVHQLTEPVMAPLRRVIPPLGMFDLTPIVAFLIINLIDGLLMPYLLRLALSFGVFPTFIVGM